jgi:hypothetical protein
MKNSKLIICLLGLLLLTALGPYLFAMDIGKRTGSQSLLSEFPDELMLHIFSFLGPRDLCRIGLVCLKWNRLAQDSCFEWYRYLRKARNNKNEAFLYAATENNIQAVKWLLDSGADVNSVDDNGCTALMMAAMLYNIKMIKFLCNYKADVTITNYLGGTALTIGSFEARKFVRSCIPNLGR